MFIDPEAPRESTLAPFGGLGSGPIRIQPNGLVDVVDSCQPSSRNRDLGHRLVDPEMLLINRGQGTQYRVTDYRDLLNKHEIICSMSAKG